jgi:hypothetical protein
MKDFFDEVNYACPMLIYTPRFGTKLAVYETSPGNLPDARKGPEAIHHRSFM